ncbi:MAG: hypothetical protein IPK83_04005 [Planctomycetes bacterium]|nr:hypothetical protein [Planctomycetota bacterium]
MSHMQNIQIMAKDLEGMLGRLGALQNRLLDEIEAKLAAMRRSDAAAMTAASHAEGEIVAKIAALDEKRNWHVIEMCKALGIQIPPRAQSISLRSICKARRTHRIAPFGGRRGVAGNHAEGGGGQSRGRSGVP